MNGFISLNRHMLYKNTIMLWKFKRAFEIYCSEGLAGLVKSIKRYFISEIGLPYYNILFRYYTFKNQLSNYIKYDAPPKAYKTINIRPNEIQYCIGSKTIQGGNSPFKPIKKRGIARTECGNWDRSKYKMHVEDLDKIKAIIHHFDKGTRWENTDIHEYYKNKYNNGVLDSKYNNIDHIYQDIKKNGYTKGHKGTHHVPKKTQPIRDQLEVLITIDRNGNIHFYEGKHRFGIARVLDLEIPAHVLCRHEQWQKTRDNIYNSSKSAEDYSPFLQNHPDLNDIFE